MTITEINIYLYNILLVSVCQLLRGASHCPELVGQLKRLFVPDVSRITLRVWRLKLFAVPAGRIVSRQYMPSQCSIFLRGYG